MHRKIIFGDHEIAAFCQATRDFNEIHDPAYMAGIGKRAIVPGMYAFACAAVLSAEFLKSEATSIRVFFNALLSSGDFAALSATPLLHPEAGMRLSAVNGKDTLTSKEEYTRLWKGGEPLPLMEQGRLHSLEVGADQLERFSMLTQASDRQVSGFLFSIAYASQALYRGIESPLTGVEEEIDQLINRGSRVSPFYHTLNIQVPPVFPDVKPGIPLDYLVHFECEKKNRAYLAWVKCTQRGELIYHSCYNLVGIPDTIILRMAKEDHRVTSPGR
jgi:hypothetical protein